ncbi:hypothetical protein PIROE2DRAFT_1599, partial [Piromyces sp. E2]
GLFLNPELSTAHNNKDEESLPNTIKEETRSPSPQPQRHRKSVDNTNFELALSHLCEVLDYEEPMVLAKYLKAANGSVENVKDAPPNINEMKNIEGNTKRQAPVIIDRKGRRAK